MEDSNNTKLYPSWKEAVQVLLREGSEPGTLITREWLNTHFGLKTPVTAEEQKKYQLEFLGYFKSFETELLTEHQIALKTTRDGGYIVLPPNQQTEWAERTALKKMSRAIHQGLNRLVNVNTAALTDAEKKENSDSLARISWVRDAVANKQKVVMARKKLLDMDLETD